MDYIPSFMITVMILHIVLFIRSSKWRQTFCIKRQAKSKDSHEYQVILPL